MCSGEIVFKDAFRAHLYYYSAAVKEQNEENDSENELVWRFV